MRTSLVSSVVMVVALAAARPGPGAEPLPAGIRPTPKVKEKAPFEKAVDRALVFLHNTQDKGDGSWTAGRMGKDVAATSLAVMAFLSAGHVPGQGKYGKDIEKSVRWVMRNQRPNGLIASAGGHHQMYQHGMATLMLSEVGGMTRGQLNADVRKAVEKAIHVIVRWQRTRGAYRGGWRYALADDSSDMSVTGWQILALRGARNLGCDVPASTMERAVEFIKRCQDPRGGFRYTPYGGVTLPCTGTGVLCLELCGKNEHRSPAVLRGAAYLVRRENLDSLNYQPYFFYSIYYGAQATFQVGDRDNYWNIYRERLHRILLAEQQGNGSWQKGTEYNGYGPNFCTALAVLALTVEFRFLPIYQRGEEPTDR
jgi:hypothetical protein